MHFPFAAAAAAAAAAVQDDKASLTLIRHREMLSLAEVHPNYQTDRSYLKRISELPRIKIDDYILGCIWRKVCCVGSQSARAAV